MKTVAYIAAIYLAVVGAATFYSGVSGNSPISDTVAGLPSAGSLLSSTGTTAALLDLGSAAALYFLVVK